MKNILILNIGLNDNMNSPLNVHTACTTLQAHGFTILASRVEDSPAGNEKCLVAGVQFHGSEIDCNARLYCVASCLRQDCIAVLNSGVGSLIGPQSEAWGDFNPAFFVGLSGKPLDTLEAPETEEEKVKAMTDEILSDIIPKLSPCQAIQAKHKAKADECRVDIGALPYQTETPREFTVNEWTVETFTKYLEERIIPDSIESGFTGYAEDLQTALEFIRHLAK